ncbi:expressed unknown protein [Seminavis robusta]|uniref:Amino acid transporter transmembrane domain-containing protein n=1 Tax=Seminavis robusta TaxID=568900 RepID=A0A9N8DWU2_9STRA|nr:expressed unknown protein [Seminavis robusta]|eukprot:Sro405_g136040.1 n/a (503) ;mRNA; r:10514-12022
MCSESKDPLPEQDDTSPQHHDASVAHTVINMAKTCMGTGCLALAFAAQQGGILLHIFGLLGLGIWNVVTVHKLCQCHSIVLALKEKATEMEVDEEARLLHSSSTATSTVYDSLEVPPKTITASRKEHQLTKNEPPKGMTTLVQLAWYALGPWGAHLLDVIMVLYLIGVIVTYLNAMRSFLGDTPFTTGMGSVDSFLLVAIMGPLSVVPHTGHLAKASAMGLLVLVATFVVIAWYGFFVENDDNSQTWHVLASDSPMMENINTTAQDSGSFWWPRAGMGGVSQWFGICVFGFGITPLAFSFRQAMQEPQQLVPATSWAMTLVALSYILLGVGLLIPFPNIQGDVLHELPSVGWIPTLTRISMVLVVLVTAPLLIVPCGELVEGKIASFWHHDDDDDEWTFHKTPWWLKATVRWSICLLCAAISSFVPGFVNVLSFVGCCCVAVVGFCVPPFLHLILSVRFGLPRGSLSARSLACSIAMDTALLVWGFLATVVSTVYTFWELSA